MPKPPWPRTASMRYSKRRKPTGRARSAAGGLGFSARRGSLGARPEAGSGANGASMARSSTVGSTSARVASASGLSFMAPLGPGLPFPRTPNYHSVPAAAEIPYAPDTYNGNFRHYAKIVVGCGGAVGIAKKRSSGMGTIRFRFIMVALVVSFFAIGMAAFLNYFKYKSTISNIVKSRVLLVGEGIESSVQASLQIGMQFAELSQLPQLLQRERSSDRLIRGIDVFDTSGQVLYSTDTSRVGQKIPEAWTDAAQHSKTLDWAVQHPEEYVAGISVKNAFNLTVGYLALRYSREDVERATSVAGREIMLAALGAFAVVAVLAPLALILVIRRFERDLQTLDAAAS